MKTLGIVMTVAFLGFAFIACGSSQEVTELNSILENYEKVVDEYVAAANGVDQPKKSEMEKQIKSLSETWTQKRNEFGSLVTPQVMDGLAKKFDTISAKLSKVAKT
jgi:uncharacterized protein YukE